MLRSTTLFAFNKKRERGIEEILGWRDGEIEVNEEIYTNTGNILSGT